MFTMTDAQNLQDNARTLARNATAEWLQTHKQITDWQIDQARQIQAQNRTLLDATLSTAEVTRDTFQTLSKTWMDVFFPCADKAQA